MAHGATLICPLDLDWAEYGYLVSFDRCCLNPVPSIAVLARDTRALGVIVYWGEPRDGRLGRTFPDSGVIVLAPRLMRRLGDTVRDVWSHELGHIVTGRSCERARAWQRGRYGTLLLSADLAECGYMVRSE